LTLEGVLFGLISTTFLPAAFLSATLFRRALAPISAAAAVLLLGAAPPAWAADKVKLGFVSTSRARFGD